MSLQTRPAVLVSASLGGIDRIPILTGTRAYDAVFFADAETLRKSDETAVRSWDSVIVPPYPRRDWTPRLRAKYFKLQIHRLLEVSNYEYLVWMDARIQILDEELIARLVARLRELPPWRRLAIFEHPERKDIREEYEYIVRLLNGGDVYLLARYAQEDMRGQLAYYDAMGWEVDGRLLSGGFWVVENSPLMARVFDEWWDHNLRFTIMDQLSLPIVLARHNIRPEIIPGSMWDNPLVKVGEHDVVK